jgi:hypothetical protein
VGFNPFREQNKTVFDIFMVVVAILAMLSLIAWAVFST